MGKRAIPPLQRLAPSVPLRAGGRGWEAPDGERAVHWQAVADRSHQVTHLAQLTAAMHSGPLMTAQGKRLEPLGFEPGTSESRPLQMAVSNSASFAPSLAAAPLITALDGQIPTAETNARRDLAHPVGGIHTPHQATYLRNPSPMNWGYCVEEKLDPLARARGWTTQWILSNSRPDYGQAIGPTSTVFVDLTSVAQAGVGGNHVTSKLHASVRPGGQTWEAADITHNGPPGGPTPRLRTNGAVSPLHMRRFQAYHKYLNKRDKGYHPKKDAMRFKYGRVSHVTFTQVWTKAERAAFSTKAKAAGFG